MDLETFKIYNLEIRSDAIKINDKIYGDMVCLAANQSTEFIFKSLEADLFDSVRGLFFTISPTRKIQEWFTTWHKNDKGATNARPWYVNLFVED